MFSVATATVVAESNESPSVLRPTIPAVDNGTAWSTGEATIGRENSSVWQETFSFHSAPSPIMTFAGI